MEFFQKVMFLTENTVNYDVTFGVILSTVLGKGTFLSENTDVFVITPNRRTFFFPETENLNFGDY